MSENRFSCLLMDPPRQEDFEFYIKHYTNGHQKFEKFKPKKSYTEEGNNILEKTDNEVKNLLSVYLKNIESNRDDSDFLNEGKSVCEKKKINSINKKNDNKTKYYINNSKEKNKNLINAYNNQNNKDILYHSNTGKNFSYNYSYFKNNDKVIKTNKFKEKINVVFKRARSFGERIIKKDKNE